MVMEYVENIVQLMCILIAQMFSLFRYIDSKKRCWLYATGFFASSLLSCYFWTAYLIIIGSTPNASDLLTYFGWNISYIVMVLLILNLRPKGERRFMHPLMLLPLPLNAWQLTLYMNFDGALLSAYQVTVCSVAACLCVRDILWHIKNRKNGAAPPFIAIAMLTCIYAEFGMWTASCFDGWTQKAYYVCSLICSASYLFMIWAINRTFPKAGEGSSVFISRRVQRILKGTYVAVFVICSLGGIVLGIWIRDRLSKGMSDTVESNVYDIIHVILFLIAVLLVVVSIGVIIIVYFEQKLSENNRLREEKLVAERSNAAKSDFLANMSHEIRTPINAVLGMNEMIMRATKRAYESLPRDREAVRGVFSEIKGYSGNIDSAGNNLLSIINDILDFSKIEAGRFDINKREYMLSSVLNDVANTVMFKARDKGLEMNIETDSDLPDELFGDDMRIRQILINLLNNAIKYTDKGSVTLTVHGSGGYTAEQMTELTIAVRDTGIGIRKEDVSRIFDKFERTDLKRNSTVEGTGLGLSITNRLVGIMNGSISVESEYGKGSVFSVRLPQKVMSAEPIGDFRARLENSLHERDSSEVLFRAPDARILIVDDTRMNLMVAAGLLSDTGMMTDTAESGQQALEMMCEQQYDIILMDQRMPVMDGVETLHRLRGQEEESGRHTPAICLTADALTGARERYLAEGFDDYLSKPIDSRELKKMMLKYLPEDKILSADDGREEDADLQNVDDLYGRLRSIGLDTEKGLGYCQNNEELYRTMLYEYVRSSAEKLKPLQDHYDSRDALNYGILVHSLKSNSRTVGEEELAELSAVLEKAADAEQWDVISADHELLTERLDKVIRAVAEAISVDFDELSAGGDGDEDEIIEFFPE
ncbi:His Kinase A (phospho-acceptor) domain-containing protein [Ruminococcus sp. YE71]|uniref:ATP-binding protein n=1 Tax=unclassified Ruminococcus TaxID=2608920 RepID=UPI000888D32B|nr:MULTISPECIES: ATP-binding protein [unclassified Ruminococcus]SDA20732.1 His Kinase A (phospho-acceptor) domain-containing protein [Ruminococcus sp. YE78]SFW33725.1 His Kinase A (phospho-acceptor) domain-containing protein [Ruminococcus sp. YE71]